MKLIKNINNKVFIFENALNESIVDLLLEDCQKHIEEKNFVARFGLVDNENPKNNMSFNKLITNLNKDEEYIWNNFKNIGSKRINRKDIESPCDRTLLNTANKHISVYLESIYINHINNLKPEHQDVLTYLPGHIMNIHSDTNQEPNLRICTTTLYLNEMKDDDEGGEIVFYGDIMEVDSPEVIKNNIIYTHRPKKNQLIVFDSYFNKIGIQHSVTEIKNWNRHVFRTYWKETKTQN